MKVQVWQWERVGVMEYHMCTDTHFRIMSRVHTILCVFVCLSEYYVLVVHAQSCYCTIHIHSPPTLQATVNMGSTVCSMGMELALILFIAGA